jgi:hypothetical protein
LPDFWGVIAKGALLQRSDVDLVPSGAGLQGRNTGVELYRQQVGTASSVVAGSG